MARILAYTSPARGHLYPITPTLLELRARGHEVHVRTLASELGALQAVGLHAAPIDPRIEELGLDDWRWKTPEEGLAGGLRTFAARSEHEVPDLTRAISDVDPDLLIVDKTTAGSTAVADASGLPWAQWIPFFEHYTPDPVQSPEVSYIPFSLVPAGIEVLNAPRRRLGLSELTDPPTLWRAPLYLYLTAPPFEYEDLTYPSQFRLVGPGLWEPPAQPPAWLEDLEPPIVLVAISSEYQRDDALIGAALEGLRSEGLRLVVSTAAHDPERFDAPENAHVVRWVPHGRILERAACVVCHAGMGITQKALAAGVPVCAVPFGRDQAGVAARVVATESGIAMMPDRLDPTALRDAVRLSMEMRAGAQRVAEGFARAGGPAATTDSVESLLSARSRTRTRGSRPHPTRPARASRMVSGARRQT